MGNLQDYLKKEVSELVAESPRNIRPEEIERNQIYSLLLLSMLAYCFNGNKKKFNNIKYDIDTSFDYGNNPIITEEKMGKFLKMQYLGHNISSFGVDRDGRIIDFDFNHNDTFNSSVQHAEARLLNRLFSLNQVYDSWNVGTVLKTSSSYSQLLQGVTVYTSLESCSQCSGIMTLGNVKEVIYLQEDPGQNKIGNILFRLTEPKNGEKKGGAPRPIPASLFGFSYYNELQRLFEEFKTETKDKSITNFLRSKIAFELFIKAHNEFANLTENDLKYSTWQDTYSYEEYDKLSDTTILIEKKTELKNIDVLKECQDFYNYFAIKGRRGTPHL